MVQPLPTGTCLGRYRIQSPIGRGGMGEVYRAHDPTLNRDIAIKILPSALLDRRDRVLRFIQEAKSASALSHPHIVTIHEIGETSIDGHPVHYIAMELIEGSTLRQAIHSKRTPLPQLIELLAQVADALAKAHAAGIVHRDLKPDNIMVTADGYAKIVDFGLAKLIEADPAPMESLVEGTTLPRTRDGVMLGTVGYMSPEQVEGKPADHRSDIFSLGCILYEAVARRRPFEGDSEFDTLNKVRTEEPPPLSGTAPARLQQIIKRCLAKDRKRRYQSIKDVALELREWSVETPTANHLRTRRWRRSVLAVAIVVGIAAGAAFVAGRFSWIGRKERNEAARPPNVVPVTSAAGYEDDPALSPDGKQIAFVARQRQRHSSSEHLYVQLVGRGEPLQLTHAEARDSHPAWSADGTEIVFLRKTREGHEVLAIPALGGTERLLARSAAPPMGLDYSPDGRYLAFVDRVSSSAPPGIFLLSLETGEKRRLSTHESIRGRRTLDTSPAFSPSGDRVAFQRVLDGTGGIGPICAQKLDERHAAIIVPAGGIIWDFDWTDDGSAIVLATGHPSSYLAEIPIAEPGGTETRRVEELDRFDAFRLPFGDRAQSVSTAKGRLVFSRFVEDLNIWRVAGPTAPDRSATEMLIASTRSDVAGDYSADGTSIVFASDRASRLPALWICDADGRNPRQLTSLFAYFPQFSPDSQRVLFGSTADGQVNAYVISVRGGAPTNLTRDKSSAGLPSWSEDERSILFQSDRVGGVWQIWRMRLDGDTLTQLTRSPGAKFRPVEHGGYVYYFYPLRTASFSTLRTAVEWGGVYRVPSAGGDEELVVDRVPYHYWSLWRGNLVYVRYMETGDAVIETMDLKTRVKRRLQTFSPDTELGETVAVTYMDVSPDGRWILLTKNDHGGADLMLVENFR